jgi:DNA-binding CsgD family transcriptional regulator
MAEWASALVGRREELAALERALAEVEQGRTRAVWLRGEPGIGKSRLLGELAARARERGVLVLEGRAAELERELPFALLSDALGPLVRGEGAQGLRALEPDQLHELAAVLPLAGVEAAPASGERHRAARALRALLELVATERPLALLLDDLQWADPASTDALALLLHRPPGGGVLVGMAARAGRAPALEATLADAVRGGTGVLLELGPLPPEAAAALLPETGPAARERLYRESGGNPFYLMELARAAQLGAVECPSHGLAGVPRAVQAALAGELAVLPDGARRVLEGAAVAGDPFEVELAAAAAGVDEEIALGALDDLFAAELVRPTSHPRRFGFRHPLVRRAVYEGAGGGWRLAAHARAAEALAAGATPAQRAHHVERAARHGDLAAVGLLVAAAEEAAAAAPATAAGWYEAALRLLPETAEHDQRRLELLGAQAIALVSAGRPADACAALRRVLALLPAGAAAERVEATVTLAGLLAVWTQQPDEARRLLEAERAALGEVTPDLGAALDLALAEVYAEYGDHAASEALADRACAEARAAGDRALEADAAGRAADAAHCRLRGDDPDALAAVDAKIGAAGEMIEALPDDVVARRLSILISVFIAHAFTGDIDAASAAVERGLALARATGQGLFAPAFVAGRALVAEQQGRLDAAEAHCEEVLESAKLSGNVQVAFWGALGFSWIALARGDIEAALAHGQSGWELLGTRSYSQAGFTLADARLAAGDPQGAEAALETFGWVNPGLWTLDRVRAAEVAVRVLLALERVEEAAELARRAPAEGGGRRTGIFGAIGAHAETAVLLARGDAPGAAHVALAGAVAAEDGRVPVWEGRCRILAGEALAAAGRTGAARAELRRAATQLEAHGAWAYRDAALRVLRRLGARPRPAAAPRGAVGDDRLAALSPRERDVAVLVGRGQTNAQIAARLHLSERTVEKHVSSLLRKLGLDSRTAVVWLLRDETVAR